MKKQFVIACAFSTILLSSCGNSNDNSFESILDKNNLTTECADKACNIKSTDEDHSFGYSLSDDGEAIFSFYSKISENSGVMYMIDGNSALVINNNSTCVLPFDNLSSSTCSADDESLGFMTKEKYNDELASLGKSEKEVFDYLKKQYDNSFVN